MSTTLVDLIHPAADINAINSVSSPTFLRHPLKISPMIQVLSLAIDSVIFFGVDLRGLVSRRQAEIKANCEQNIIAKKFSHV